MDDKITVQCTCGQRYRVGADKDGKTLRCKSCGASFTAAAQAPEPPGAEPDGHSGRQAPIAVQDAPRAAMQASGDLAIRDPAELLADIHATGFARLVLIAALVHFLLLGLTSFGLYAQWRQYWEVEPKGFKLPHKIKAIQKEEAEKAHQLALQEEEKKRKEETAKAAAEKAAKEEADKAKAPRPAEQPLESGGNAEKKDTRSDYQKKVEDAKIMERPSGSSLQLDVKDLNP